MCENGSFTLKFSKYEFSSISRNSHSVILFFSGCYFPFLFSIPELHSPLCTPPSSEAEEREKGLYFPIFPTSLPLAPLIDHKNPNHELLRTGSREERPGCLEVLSLQRYSESDIELWANNNTGRLSLRILC